VVVGISGAVSGVFVVIANAWMNTPRGFRIVGGQPADIHPLLAMLTPAALPEALHMTVAAYAATGLAVAGIHALLLLRQPQNAFHRRALAVSLLVGAPAAVVQPVTGDISARYVARWQPIKLAAMEGDFVTQRGAPLRLGGLPDETRRVTPFAIEIPYGLSLLAFHDPQAVVRGLGDFPHDQWPPVAIVHASFQIMVALGTMMALVAAWALLRLARGREPADSRWMLRSLVLVAPMGFIAIEAGWIVTEVGRQPWIVYGFLRTADAVTPMPGLIVPFVTFTLLYCGLGAVVAWLLYQHVVKSPQHEDGGTLPQRPHAA
jgi:cytochrome d ubiquinol oxidase subunit I